MSTAVIANPSLNRASQRQIRVALITVVTPVIGLIVAIVFAWGWGITSLELGMLGVMYVLSVLGVELGLHRYFTHRSFKATKPVTAVLGILGSMAGQGPILFWAATHRQHHAHSDRAGDPHSPHRINDEPVGFWRGFWHSHVGWMFVGEVPDIGTYVPDLLRDRQVFRLNQWYPLWLLLGLIVPAAISGLVTGTAYGAFLGFLWGGLVRIFLVHHVTWSVNSVCHLMGSRPHATREMSTNVAWLAVPTLGSAWHNNHHAYPRAAFTSMRWWQCDPSGWVVQAMELTGLAWDVQRIRVRPSVERISDPTADASQPELPLAASSEAQGSGRD